MERKESGTECLVRLHLQQALDGLADVEYVELHLAPKSIYHVFLIPETSVTGSNIETALRNTVGIAMFNHLPDNLARSISTYITADVAAIRSYRINRAIDVPGADTL